MTDTETENIAITSKEVGPTTNFGAALVGFADRMDALATKETNLTHRQLWLALGTEAVVGAIAIGAVGSGSEVSSKDIVFGIMEKMNYTGTVTGQDWGIRMQEGQWNSHSGWGFPDMKVGDFARTLIEGGFKNKAGKSVFLLNNESTANIVKQLNQLGDFEGKIDQLRNLFLLGGVGSAVVAALQAKAGERVKVSAPVGKIPAVLPTIANVMKGIGKMF